MNKCEWKNEKFYPCKDFNGAVEVGSNYTCCIKCRVDIMKPEPEAELTTEEKSDILIKIMSTLGVSVHDFISNFIPEPDDSIIMCLKCYCANTPARVTCSECGTGLFHE